MDNKQRKAITPLKSAVVASNVKHALAMMKWLKLSDNEWTAVSYGDRLVGKRFNAAICLRPISGAEDADTDWIVDQLRPAVRGEIIAAGLWSHNLEPDYESATQQPQSAFD